MEPFIVYKCIGVLSPCSCVYMYEGQVSRHGLPLTHTCSLRQCLSLAWNSSSSLDWLASEFYGSFCVHPPRAEVTVIHQDQLLHRCWDPVPCPQVCRADTTGWAISQPQGCFFFVKAVYTMQTQLKISIGQIMGYKSYRSFSEEISNKIPWALQ